MKKFEIGDIIQDAGGTVFCVTRYYNNRLIGRCLILGKHVEITIGREYNICTPEAFKVINKVIKHHNHPYTNIFK